MANVDTLLDSALLGVDGKLLNVNAETRTIEGTNNLILGVESDEKTERIYFTCPKYVGNNIDLTTLRLYINYQNANSDKNSYLIEDMADNGDDTITFSWELYRSVTEYKGTVTFILCAKKSLEDGTLTNEWNTTIASATVLQGLEATEQIVEQNADVIEQILTKLENIEESGGTVDLTPYQKKEDEDLETDSKTVVGAINEINAKSNEGIPTLTGTTDSPIILRDLLSGTYIFDGKVVPYSGGTATTYSNNFAMVQKTSSKTYVQVMYGQNNNLQYYEISNTTNTFEKTTTSFDKLQQKQTISKNTNSTSVTTQLANNLFYQCQNELTNLTLKFPTTIDDDYKSTITFKSGATATVLTLESDVIFYGQDVSNSKFTPQPSKPYYIEFYKNVDGLSAYVRIDQASGSSYELPIANSTTLGGVKPVAKTSDMTQAVGVDENGGLFTFSVGSGSKRYKLLFSELYRNVKSVTDTIEGLSDSNEIYFTMTLTIVDAENQDYDLKLQTLLLGGVNVGYDINFNMSEEINFTQIIGKIEYNEDKNVRFIRVGLNQSLDYLDNTTIAGVYAVNNYIEYNSSQVNVDDKLYINLDKEIGVIALDIYAR